MRGTDAHEGLPYYMTLLRAPRIVGVRWFLLFRLCFNRLIDLP